MSHQCPVSGCGSLIADDKLMCFRHWSLVPEGLRRRVHSAWSAVRLSRIASKRRDALERYRDVREAAITAVGGNLLA